MSHNKQTNIATTGSRGRNPFLIAGGHGLSMQYLLTSGRMSDADNLKLPQT